MKFRTLQDNLRRELLRRIEGGQLTGLKLAQQTGFQQAHISNFLNRKRGLSLEGMDKVMAVQKLTVFDLLDPAEVNRRASIPAPSNDEFENVLMVQEPASAALPVIQSTRVGDVLKFKKSFLKRLKPNMESPRQDWLRFVALRTDSRDGLSMYPRMMPGATVLIDRHYNSLAPYRKGDPNMYAVLRDGCCTIKYVELAGDNMVLRPQNQAYPVDVQSIDSGRTYADYLIGRVCWIGIET